MRDSRERPALLKEPMTIDRAGMRQDLLAMAERAKYCDGSLTFWLDCRVFAHELEQYETHRTLTAFARELEQRENGSRSQS